MLCLFCSLFCCGRWIPGVIKWYGAVACVLAASDRDLNQCYGALCGWVVMKYSCQVAVTQLNFHWETPLRKSWFVNCLKVINKNPNTCNALLIAQFMQVREKLGDAVCSSLFIILTFGIKDRMALCAHESGLEWIRDRI